MECDHKSAETKSWTMDRKILMLVCLLVAAAPGLAFSASVYKWTDENGVVHFGDRQPTGQASEKINVRTGTPAADNDRASPQERLKSLQEEQDKEAASEQEKARQEAIRKQRQAACEKARKNLETLNTYSRIRIEEEDGEIRYLSPEEIEAQREKHQRLIEENCGPETDTGESE